MMYEFVLYEFVVYEFMVYEFVTYDFVVYEFVVYESVMYESVVYDSCVARLDFTMVYEFIVYEWVVYEIKREYNNARTSQQKGVAERNNKTLIEAARTMLADSFLPNTFWAEAVSTACKFEEKSDEGFLVGYSLSSKAFRVYNLETNRVEDNLHINLLENKPNVAGKGTTWLFDLDYLTDSMNYQPITAENKANKIAGPKEANNSAGTQDNLDTGSSQMEADYAQECYANDAAKTLRKMFAQSTEDLLLQAGAARASDTNYDIYEVSRDGIFTSASYDDEGVVADFTNLETIVNVYKVIKALYGLQQAPRAWYTTLSTFLVQSGYRRGLIDKTLFINKDKKGIMLVQVYVDDIIFGSTKKSWCDEFEALMKNRFQMSYMGELTFFIGLQVKQKEDVAERKNRTLIEAARTMLADSFLPNTFWAEAVNTACYVLNRPVTAKNKANKTTGLKEANNSAYTQDNINAGNFEMEAEHVQKYCVLPLWYSYTLTVKSSEAKNEDKKFIWDIGLKINEEPVDQEDQAFLEELESLKRQAKEANDAAKTLRKTFAKSTEDLLLQAGAARASSTNNVNTASTPVNTASTLVSTASTPVHTASTPGAVSDFTNLESTVNVSPILQSRIHSIHPTTQILRDPTSAIQTRSKVNKSSGAHAFIEPKKISQALEEES
nr:copia protein [Tanacetum cinerariifolium]